MARKKDDREVIRPPEHSAEVGGETLHVAPLSLAELPAFLDAVEQALPENTLEEIDLQACIGHNAEALSRMLAIGLRRDTEWVSRLDYAGLTAALGLLVKANRDFFIHLVARRARQQARQMASTAMAATHSPTSSPASSVEATTSGT